MVCCVRMVGSVGEDWGRSNSGSAAFCLLLDGGLVAKQWVGEESKSPESGQMPDSVGWDADDAGGWG